MIAVETNILVYAHRRDSPWHEQAAAVIRRLAEGVDPWAIPWPSVYEFVGIATHPRIYRPPSLLTTALDQVDAWLESPSVVLLGESESHWPLARATLAAGQIVGPAVHDGRIAALCLAHGVSELWTADRDFTRFSRLSCRNPLVS